MKNSSIVTVLSKQSIGKSLESMKELNEIIYHRFGCNMHDLNDKQFSAILDAFNYGIIRGKQIERNKKTSKGCNQ